MTMDGKLPSKSVMSRTRTLCIVMSIGIAVFLGRILYERHVLHVVDDRALFFSALHSDYALLFWASLVLYLGAHALVPFLLLWMAMRRGSWLRLLPFVGLIALELCIGLVVYGKPFH